MAKLDPETKAHLEWLGYVRPIGLVVSAPALVRAGAILDRHDLKGQIAFQACIQTRSFAGDSEPTAWLPDFRIFATSVLGWDFSPPFYAGTPQEPIPAALEAPLADAGEVLSPDLAVSDPDANGGSGEPGWQLLVSLLEPGQGLDDVDRGDGQLETSPHGRLERLLRLTRVPAGLLFNGRSIRLLSAPHGESSGWLDFRVADMEQTAGRPIVAALRMLLGQARLLSAPRPQRLPSLLADSRKYQNEVSERLAEQVLHALYELLRGFQAAHDTANGQLLGQVLGERPDEVYRGLLTVILRLVFLLFAEERDMLPEDGVFLGNYSLAGLYDRLRDDAALFPDTMDQRFGAWAQLLVLFRMIHDGADAGVMHLPRRHGVLFDPDRFPFLEGRRDVGVSHRHARIEPPAVPDGTIYRALEKLLVLDGERISYRALDVEQIGSVYETMMGFRLESATGRSVAIKAPKTHGAPTAVDLDALLREPAAKREKWLQERAGRKLTDNVKKAVNAAASLEDLHAALATSIDRDATPDLVPRGAMVLQPSEVRRRSGSHYTPRSLTEPIVRTTIEPILARLRGPEGQEPRPEQILDLKVLDPAMGSGAFLVEACRQLGEELVNAWRAHGGRPTLPSDEDEVIFARRLVAQRCLYGVDRNPVAVDLAKVSLWLATLARDHSLTFVDHALRHGDSLVGLSRRQLEAFHWDPKQPILKGLGLRDSLDQASALRRQIREAGEGVTDRELRDLWDEAQKALRTARLVGDLVVTAFLDGATPKDREAMRVILAGEIASGGPEAHRSKMDDRRHRDPPIAPFHWDIEFSEVFDRDDPGFDGIVGNPPFMSGVRISEHLGLSYNELLVYTFQGASRKVDLCAFFFRRAYSLLRRGGSLGLLATNTIAQSTTRRAGLDWILDHGGFIYAAETSRPWPGSAAVVVAVVWISKQVEPGACVLDGQSCRSITSLLQAANLRSTALPQRLKQNGGRCYQGSSILGMGFFVEEQLALAMRSAAPKNADVVRPCIGGRELNEMITSVPQRWIIDMGERDEPAARAYAQPFNHLEATVKEERLQKNEDQYPRLVRTWWKFWHSRQALYQGIQTAGLTRVLARARVCNHHMVAFLPADWVYTEQLAVFVFDDYSSFAVLQSGVHEVWARKYASTMKTDTRYVPPDCFETFPLPANWHSRPTPEAAGHAYYDFRGALMFRNDQGLTKTYNRFHDPNERDPDILRLRELHAAIDRAVLDAYGWSDIPADCDFFLDHDVDEEEGERKKPRRYRWPDEVRDEVLARLLELNATRAAEEARSGLLAGKATKGTRKVSAKHGQRKSNAIGDLFE